MNVIEKLLSTASIKHRAVSSGLHILTFKRSGRPNNMPTKFNHTAVPGEILINTADKRIWITDDNGNDIEIELLLKETGGDLV